MPRRRTEAEKQEGRRKSERERAGKNRAKARAAGVPTPAQIDRAALDGLVEKLLSWGPDDRRASWFFRGMISSAVGRLGVDPDNPEAVRVITRRITERSRWPKG